MDSRTNETRTTTTTSHSVPEGHSQNLMHCKCRIVKLVRGQMARLDKNKDLENNLRKEAASLFRKIYRWRYYILGAMLFLLLSWMLLVYGALIGAALCGRSMLNSGSCAGCRGGKYPHNLGWDAKLTSVF